MATSARVLAQDPILLTGVNAGIATLTLNRPRQYNALSEDMLIALQEALDDIAGDDTVRVVVIAANGKAFCAGTTSRKCVPVKTGRFTRHCLTAAGR